MKTADFAFELPAELIAQEPLPERSASRLLTVEANTAACSHLTFRDLPQLLTADDLLVFNNTRVIPARLFAQKQTGGRVEILIERVKVMAALWPTSAPVKVRVTVRCYW